jgi:hypothetical protein
MLRFALIALALLLPQPGLAAGYPQRSIEGAEDGVPSGFAGQWEMLRPEGPETQGGDVVTGCDNPVAITAEGEKSARFRLPTTAYDEVMELSAVRGGTRWKPAQGSGFFSVWTSPRSFYLFNIDMMGRPDWGGPTRLTRCE